LILCNIAHDAQLSTRFSFDLILTSGSIPPEQLRQPHDVDGYSSRLVLRQHLCLESFGYVVAGVDVRERLPVGIPDDKPPGSLSARQGAGKRRGGFAMATTAVVSTT
jgi:hypothetical protein